MKYIKKIIVTVDEVYHYSWLDSIDIVFYLENNTVINTEFSQKFIYGLITSKIRKKLSINTDYFKETAGFMIRCKEIADEEKIIPLLEEACDYYINNKMVFEEKYKKIEEFYLENYLVIKEFLEEIKEFIKNKDITYYYQSVDGFN
jgi:hypothetical protein